jgi:excisionase family DNA binding protein
MRNTKDGSESVLPSPRLLWSVADTAEALGVSARTVWRMLATGELPSRRVGRCVRIPGAAVVAFTEAAR